ncbi:MAG: hypothetical protein JWO09_2613 [Bacteroidetes bacterium]|nr:hypothetical protein [Bacteroidota bacterium]
MEKTTTILRYSFNRALAASALLLAPFLVSAQIPGYLGKRLMVGYSNNFFLSTVDPTASSYDLGMNTTHSLNVEYTIKNRTNICASFQMFRTGIAVNTGFIEYRTTSSGSTTVKTYTYYPIPDAPMVMKTKCLALGFKFFKRGSFAPLGKYRKLEAVLMFSNISYQPLTFRYIQGNKTGRASLGSGNYSYKEFAVTYTLGRQRILFDRLVVDYGVQFGFMPLGALSITDYSGTVNITNYPGAMESVLREESNMRLFRYELFNIHLGLGFLAL